MPSGEEPRVLLIVPTLGKRPDYLRACLSSIRSQSVASDLVLVRPSDASGVDALAREFGALTLDDPGSLPAAINLGANAAKPNHEFINWLGDDDLLEPNSLERTTAALDHNARAVVAFGHCRYIDGDGKTLWMSKAGRLATWILPWGPDLIPQPGMLVRKQAWNQVRGVDTSYRFAFDLDLLLKLRKLGPFVSIPGIVSSFRWHANSLTVSDRSTNIAESERAKRANLSPAMRPLAAFWEPPVRWATRIAANRVSQRATS